MRGCILKMMTMAIGLAMCLASTGCSKDPEKVTEAIMKEYGLIVTSLNPETSCEDAAKSATNFNESGYENQRKALDDYNTLSRDNKKKVTAELTKQVKTLNEKHWVPFKKRCPNHAPQVGKILGGYMRRFGVE